MDFNDQIGTQFRKVQKRTHDDSPAYAVIGAREFPIAPTDVWDAVTNPNRIPLWFLPLTGDLRAGGHYQLEGNAGGKISRCDAPAALDLTWEIGGAVSWVNLRFDAAPDGTRLTLEHLSVIDGDVNAASADHWNKYGPGAVGVGWDFAFHGLALHFKFSGAQIDADEYMTWMVSDPGKDFARKSADGWGAAHIESGEDPAVAQRMATETAKFYTGEA